LKGAKKFGFGPRSEKRNFGKSTRCLIPPSHFFEFTAPADPKQKRKDKWRFTLADADWFCIAGIVRPDAIDGEACFTMLTTEPEADVAPYRDRQIVVLRREDWADELGLAEAVDLLVETLEQEKSARGNSCRLSIRRRSRRRNSPTGKSRMTKSLAVWRCDAPQLLLLRRYLCARLVLVLNLSLLLTRCVTIHSVRSSQ
jgi:putative SOS response-associated peptidase YedK